MQSVDFNLRRFTIDSDCDTMSVAACIVVDEKSTYQAFFSITSDGPSKLLLRNDDVVLQHTDGDNSDIATAVMPDIQQVHNVVYYCVRQMLHYFSDLYDYD